MKPTLNIRTHWSPVREPDHTKPSRLSAVSFCRLIRGALLRLETKSVKCTFCGVLSLSFRPALTEPIRIVPGSLKIRYTVAISRKSHKPAPQPTPKAASSVSARPGTTPLRTPYLQRPSPGSGSIPISTQMAISRSCNAMPTALRTATSHSTPAAAPKSRLSPQPPGRRIHYPRGLPRHNRPAPKALHLQHPQAHRQ